MKWWMTSLILDPCAHATSICKQVMKLLMALGVFNDPIHMVSKNWTIQHSYMVVKDICFSIVATVCSYWQHIFLNLPRDSTFGRWYSLGWGHMKTLAKGFSYQIHIPVTILMTLAPAKLVRVDMKLSAAVLIAVQSYHVCDWMKFKRKASFGLVKVVVVPRGVMLKYCISPSLLVRRMAGFWACRLLSWKYWLFSSFP